jgi:hypothetical protein
MRNSLLSKRMSHPNSVTATMSKRRGVEKIQLLMYALNKVANTV